MIDFLLFISIRLWRLSNHGYKRLLKENKYYIQQIPNVQGKSLLKPN